MYPGPYHVPQARTRFTLEHKTCFTVYLDDASDRYPWMYIVFLMASSANTSHQNKGVRDVGIGNGCDLPSGLRVTRF